MAESDKTVVSIKVIHILLIFKKKHQNHKLTLFVKFHNSFTFPQKCWFYSFK